MNKKAEEIAKSISKTSEKKYTIKKEQRLFFFLKSVQCTLTNHDVCHSCILYMIMDWDDRKDYSGYC